VNKNIEMFENLTNVSETKKYSGQKETWSGKQGERSGENIDRKHPETRAVNVHNEALATNDEASECSPVDAQPIKAKHELTIK